MVSKSIGSSISVIVIVGSHFKSSLFFVLLVICYMRYVICVICYTLSRQLYFISRICPSLPFEKLSRLSIVTEAVVLALIAICTTDVGFSSISCPVTKMTTESGGGGWGGWGGRGWQLEIVANQLGPEVISASCNLLPCGYNWYEFEDISSCQAQGHHEAMENGKTEEWGHRKRHQFQFPLDIADTSRK